MNRRLGRISIACAAVTMLGCMGTAPQGAYASIGATHTTSSATPADPHATEKAQQLYRYLYGLTHDNQQDQLVGQFVGFPEEIGTYFLSDVDAATGAWPAIVHVDYEDGWRPYPLTGGVDYVDANAVAVDYSKHGGLVEVGWHPHNPLTDGSFTSPGGPPGQGPGNAASMSEAQFADLATPGTPEYAKWHAKLDQVAAGLAQLQRQGIPVLFRPLHEMEDSWAWWQDKQPDDYVAVYRDIVDYLTVTKGLHNVLFVWCPNGYRSATDQYYPGDQYVDVVADDEYGQQTDLSQAESDHPNKIIAVAEDTAHVDLHSIPSVAFGNAWNDNEVGGYYSIESNDPRSLMGDPRTIGRAELPSGLAGTGAVGTSYSGSLRDAQPGTLPGPWQDGVTGGGSGTWQVGRTANGNALVPASDEAAAAATLPTDLADVMVSAAATPQGPAPPQGGFWLAVRWNTRNENVLAGYSYTDHAWEIRQNIGVANEDQVLASTPAIVNDDHACRLRVAAKGNTVRLSVDDQLVAVANQVRKYWPGEVGVVADQTLTGFGGVQMQGTDLSTSNDPALERPATAASSMSNGQHNISQLVDGVVYPPAGTLVEAVTSDGYLSSDAWNDPHHQEWVTVDLGSDRVINTVTLYPRYDTTATDGGSADFPVDFTIQVRKAANTEFATVRTVTGQTNPKGQPQTYHFGEQHAQFVRILVTKLGEPAQDTPGTYRLGLAELTTGIG